MIPCVVAPKRLGAQNIFSQLFYRVRLIGVVTTEARRRVGAAALRSWVLAPPQREGDVVLWSWTATAAGRVMTVSSMGGATWRLRSKRQAGQVVWARSQESIQGAWKAWRHMVVSSRTASPLANSDRHTACSAGVGMPTRWHRGPILWPKPSDLVLLFLWPEAVRFSLVWLISYTEVVRFCTDAWELSCWV